MDTHVMFGVSLTASFLAGVLALFAPFCITFLFPTYLGTIFKENRKVMYYTLVFALGLSFILVPIALGFRFFVFFLDSFHAEVYYVGAAILIFMGVMTLKPFFHIPQFFRHKPELDADINTASVFGLGLMSGLTSSCCAPVLFAAVTLTTLSPSLLQALIVAFAYVLGIVFPLFVLSLGYTKTTQTLSGQTRRKIYTVCRYLGAAIFIGTGILIAIFNYLGKITMDDMTGYSTTLRLLVFEIAKYFQNPILDVSIFLIILFIFYKLLKRI